MHLSRVHAFSMRYFIIMLWGVIPVSALNSLEKYIPEPEFPSLLHEDLLSGNAYTSPEGNAWILDQLQAIGDILKQILP